MRVSSSLLAAAPLIALGSCHSVILNAQGLDNSPASVGFQVDPAVARNCITINPCQQDTTIIRDAEIKANIVNQCGRTQLKGNVDVGENTENALAANKVTQVKPGSEITVTLHQVNADGAGPYFCDLDQTSNSGIGRVNLTVTNNVPGSNGLSQNKAQAFNITVKMPDQLKCTGSSVGNVCTVRCRNNAVAGPFGGCFAVQQLEIEKTVNSMDSIKSAQSLTSVQDQVRKNQADFQDAVKANEQAGSDVGQQNLAAVNALLKESVVTKSFAKETPTVVVGGGAPAATTIQSGGGRNGSGNGNGNGSGNGNGNGNGNGGNANGNQGGNGNRNGNGNQGGNSGSGNGNGNANGNTRGNGNANARNKRARKA